MSRDPFRPLTINNKTVSWCTVSGRVKGLRRHPETDQTQQVTEFWIKDDTGKETPVKLDGDLMLAEGQRVSAVYGSRTGWPKSPWLVLVNHDAQSHHSLESARGFLHKAGVFFLVPRWVFFVLLGVGLLAFLYNWGQPPVVQGSQISALWTVSLWPWLALCLAPAAAVGAYIGWQSLRVRQTWKEVEAAVAGMVDSLLGKTGDIDRAEPKDVSVLPKVQGAAEPGDKYGTIQAAVGDSGRTSDLT
jgi:hypothetical protein